DSARSRAFIPGARGYHSIRYLYAYTGGLDYRRGSLPAPRSGRIPVGCLIQQLWFVGHSFSSFFKLRIKLWLKSQSILSRGSEPATCNLQPATCTLGSFHEAELHGIAWRWYRPGRHE